MAKYRQVHVSFWQDTFVLDLTPEEKYFYLYLMTNSKTSACGIYELPKKVIELETGYNRETVDKLLGRFIEYGKVKYSELTKEIYLPNWIKFNEPKGELTAKCVVAELNAVKCRAFAESYIRDANESGYSLEGATKGLTSPLQGADEVPTSPYQVMDKDMDKETEREKEGARRRRATSAPTVFEITPVLSEWAKANGVNQAILAGETEKFLDHHRANGSAFKDWDAAWRKWMRNARDWAKAPQPQQRPAAKEFPR